MRCFDMTGKDVKKELISIFSMPQGTVEIFNRHPIIVSQYDLTLNVSEQRFVVNDEWEDCHMSCDIQQLSTYIDMCDPDNRHAWNVIRKIRDEILVQGKDRICYSGTLFNIEVEVNSYYEDSIDVTVTSLCFTMYVRDRVVNHASCDYAATDTVLLDTINRLTFPLYGDLPD